MTIVTNLLAGYAVAVATIAVFIVGAWLTVGANPRAEGAESAAALADPPRHSEHRAAA